VTPPEDQMGKVRYGIITWNDFPLDYLTILQNEVAADKPLFTYIVGQEEIGEEGKRRHVQAAIYNRTGLSKKAIGQKLRCHVELQRFGKSEWLLEYCQKSKTAVPDTIFTFGEKPETAKHSGRAEMAKAIQDGETDEAKLFEQYGATYMGIYKGARHCIDLVKEKKSPELPPEAPWSVGKPSEPKRNIIWLYGKAGVGKDRRVKGFCYEAQRTLYRHDPTQGMWFDNYKGQKAVVFSDFGGHQMKYSEWKALFDPMEPSFQGQVKGMKGGVTVSATHLYFTSDYHPIDTWKCLRKDPNAWAQVERRICQILHVTEDIDGPECTSMGFEDVKGKAPPEQEATVWNNPNFNLM